MNALSKTFSLILAGLIVTTQSAAEDRDDLSDKDFLIKAAANFQAEIEYSKLADKRAGSDKLKSFAGDLLKDQKKAQENLAALLKDRKIAIVAGTEKETRDEVKRLSQYEGKEFDRVFLERIIKDHKKAIDFLDKWSTKSASREVRDFAKEASAMMRKHLERAEGLQNAG